MSTALAVPDDWDDKSVALAAELARKRIEGQIKFWYCDRGRVCDGKPHEKYPYKHARGDQWPPVGHDWFVWLIKSGRGSGKTRTGAEWLRKMSERVPRMAMVGRRGPDVRGTMVEGESGLIAVCERAGVTYDWQPSKKEFTFGNGSVAFGYSGEEPDSLRGPQHGVAWLDEPAHIVLIQEVWDNLLMGLRLDGVPGGSKVLCTSTPLPTKWLKALMLEDTTITTTVSTLVNLDNLDPNFRRNVIARYEGTRLGRQELHGEVLEDVEGALWSSDLIRYTETPMVGYDRVVVAVDPAGSSSRRADETGIVVVGKIGDQFYVLADYSGRYTPSQWAKKVEFAFIHHEADVVIVERNYGQEMIGSVFTAAGVELPIKEVNSRRGKAIRAESIVALYEQSRVWHIDSADLTALVTQMLEWVPTEGPSPDRVDALVHGLLHLSGGHLASEIAIPGARRITDTPRLSLGWRRSALRSRS